MTHVLLLAGAILFCSTAVSAHTAGVEIQWAPVWNVSMNGVRYSVETFSSRLAVKDTVRRIVADKGDYDHYLVADGRMLLSGLRDGVHRIVEVHGSPEGSAGYVSALYFDPATTGTSMAMQPQHRRFEFDGSGTSISVDWTDAASDVSRDTASSPFGNLRDVTRFMVTDPTHPSALVSIMER